MTHIYFDHSHLLPLLPDNDEDCVPEVPDLGEVEDVQDGSCGRGGGREIVTGDDSVVVSVRDKPCERERNADTSVRWCWCSVSASSARPRFAQPTRLD